MKKKVSDNEKRNRDLNKKHPHKTAKRTVKSKKNSRKKLINSKQKKQRKKRKLMFLSELLFTFLIVTSLLYILSFFTFTTAKVTGYGMTHSINNNERVLVDRLAPIKRFDLIYFRVPGVKETSVRRIIGLPGEKLAYINDELYINDTLVAERFLANELINAKRDNYMYTEDFSLDIWKDNSRVPKGHYFVLGDNRPFSSDSRYYGYIDEKDVIGVVTYRLLPLHRATKF